MKFGISVRTIYRFFDEEDDDEYLWGYRRGRDRGRCSSGGHRSPLSGSEHDESSIDAPKKWNVGSLGEMQLKSWVSKRVI